MCAVTNPPITHTKTNVNDVVLFAFRTSAQQTIEKMFCPFLEPARGSGVQPRGRAKEEVPGDNQPQQHGSHPGRQAQELLDTLGPAGHAASAGDRDPGDPGEHAVPPHQAPPEAVIQAELAVGVLAGGHGHEPSHPRRRHHGH